MPGRNGKLPILLAVASPTWMPKVELKQKVLPEDRLRHRKLFTSGHLFWLLCMCGEDYRKSNY